MADAPQVEIFANLFKAVVDEGSVLLRSWHTAFVKETLGFGTALVTPEGEMFARPSAGRAQPGAAGSGAGRRFGALVVTDIPTSDPGSAGRVVVANP